MKLTFLGTRGNIPLRSRTHRRHAALLVSSRAGRLLIDCGADWLGSVGRLRPTAVIVTHGHPDHAAGLRRGAPCRVYATAATWRIMLRWPIVNRCVLPIRHPVSVAGFTIEAWPVQHSLIAPAIGVRISSRDGCIWYAPDVASLEQPARALADVDLYVGDGAALIRSLVRARRWELIGHASVAAQLDWCHLSGVGRAIFTHCGSGLVRMGDKRAEAIVRTLGNDRGVDARLARDGLTVTARRAGSVSQRRMYRKSSAPARPRAAPRSV